ncbi:hypothetical protein Scep_000027 [Stephania cephalantha]|uniref:FAR1 domain-containing protein n=1 Tax=Stephania cephalantha TaxID=152367 RepID=A0AAP0L5S3_9MAGN
MEFQPLTIETDVIEFDIIGSEEDDDDDENENPDCEEDDFAAAAGGGGVGVSDPDPSLEPYEGMEFDSEEAARIFYNSYARRLGFSIRSSTYHRSRRDSSIICRHIVCSRQGFHHSRDRPTNNKHKRPRPIQRVGCKAMIIVKKQDSGAWLVSKLVKQHNHQLVPPDKVHRLRSHRHVSGTARSLIDTLQAADEGSKSLLVYNVAMDALKEAAKKVVAAKKRGSGLPQVGLLTNGSSQEVCVSEGSRLDSLKFSLKGEKDKKILELMSDLESANQRCEIYRMNLLAVLKDMEEQKLKLSVKVQNVKLSLKD